jgi:hypothetical protein
MDSEEVKKETPEESPPVIKPKTDVEMLMEKFSQMEARYENKLAEEKAKNVKPKRKASEKQLEVLRKAREKRTENMQKRKEIKKDMKIQEKKIVNEFLETKNLEEKNLLDNNEKHVKFEDTPVNPVVEKQPDPPMETAHRTNPNIPQTPAPAISPPQKPKFTFASRSGRRGIR